MQSDSGLATENITTDTNNAIQHNHNGAAAHDESHHHIDEDTNIKQEEGRNGTNGDDAAEPPRKRARLGDSVTRSRGPSPPWKSFKAEGPTAIIVDGRRKSTRAPALENDPPSEGSPQPFSRGATAGARPQDGVQQNGLPPPTVRRKVGRPRKQPVPFAPPSSSPKPATSSLPSKLGPANDTSSPAKRDRKPKRPTYVYELVTPETTRNIDSPVPEVLKEEEGDGPIRTRRRRSSRASKPSHRMQEPDEEGAATKRRVGVGGAGSAAKRTKSVKLRINPPRSVFREGDLLHPRSGPPPKKFESFTAFLDQDDPLEREVKEPEDRRSDRITEQETVQEAKIRNRIVDAAQPGGVLSEERCSLYIPEKAEEPPPQYGHFNHVVAHALHLRKLMEQEQRKHKANAKRLAYEALSSKIRPRSMDEVWAEEEGYIRKRYQQVVSDMKVMWAIVAGEVNRRRHARWEEEQQALGKKALDDMLDKSTYLLGQRGPRHSSEFSVGESEGDYSDEEKDDDTLIESRTVGNAEDGSDVSNASSEAASDVMSSDDEDEEEEQATVDPDAGLTLDQLREKYAAAEQVTINEFEASEDESDTDSDNDDEMDGEDEGFEQQASLKDMLTHSETGPNQADESAVDYSNVQLEEVAEDLMDDSEDASGSATEEDSDEITSDDSDAASGEESGSDDNGANPLLNFFNKKTRESLAQEHKPSLFDRDSPLPKNVDAARNSRERSQAPDESHSDAGLPPDSLKLTNGHVSPLSPKSMSDRKAADERSKSDAMEVEELPSQPTPSTVATRTPVPSLLRGTLREYQHDGLHWLAGLYESGTNGILADEMGLGKTIQTIALLAHLAVEKEIWGPHLVVVPTSVMLNWEMEFKKFCPGFKILTYYGTIEERKVKRRGWSDGRWNVVVTSYQLILQDAPAFKRVPWYYMILDEAHNIKNFQTQRWQTMLTFRTERRLLLTGTPLQNNLQELWSLLFFLMPSGDDGHGGFAGLQSFNTAMSRPTNQILEQGRQELDAEAQAVVKQLHSILRPYLLRRLKNEVEKQMPSKYEHVVYCRLSKRQRQLYDEFMGRKETREALSGGNYMSVIACLMSLRKVCNHPDLFETRQIVTSLAVRSAVASCEISEFLVRKRLFNESALDTLELDYLNLSPISDETVSKDLSFRRSRISAERPLLDLVERHTRRLRQCKATDASSMQKLLLDQEPQADAEWNDRLRQYLSLTRQRMQRKPFYGASLLAKFREGLDSTLAAKESVVVEDRRPNPAIGFPGSWVENRKLRYLNKAPASKTTSADWFLSTSSTLLGAVSTLEARAEQMAPFVERFACVTPKVVTAETTVQALGPQIVTMARQTKLVTGADPFHEAQTRLSIAFPDRRLLQFDCGKLQRLDKLLRDLQSGGHRALIFTQMTKVLDILEAFLNIHGHRYLRLDGATKVEQRQLLTERFNNDPSILCFILSSRSGGLGINLTGADTVIFYDLDWNPAMDKQCQDRCHRIGQTRDVHIYRFVSEYTVEANILRKSNQKRLLDDVIIQKGDFTTDNFNRVTYQDALDDAEDHLGEDAEANTAIDRILGDTGNFGKVLASVEDIEDTAAATVAQKEIVHEVHVDEEDFRETNSTHPSGTSVPATPADPHMGASQAVIDATVAELEEDERPHVDEFMLSHVEWELRDIPFVPPSDRSRKKAKKGQDHRVKRKR